MPSGCRQAAIASAISAGGSLSEPSARGEIGGREHAVADRGKIARTAAAERKPRQARGRDRAPPAGASAYRRALPCRRQKLSTASSRRAICAGIGQRRRQPLRQQARAGGGHRAVDRIEQRAAPLARQCAHQFEIAARRLVDRHRRAGAFAQRRRQRRALADLRALDIGDAGRRGRQLQPRERAERFAGGDREEGRQPPLGGRAVEHVARERRHRRQRAPIGRKIRLAVQRIGHDDLAGLEPCDLGGERDAVAFGHAEFAGRDIDPGQREARFLACGGQPRARNSEQIIVASGIEQRVLGERAGRDQPHDIAPHHALRAALARLGRIFKLLAHRDAVAERDQSVQIFVGADRPATPHIGMSLPRYLPRLVSTMPSAREATSASSKNIS